MSATTTVIVPGRPAISNIPGTKTAAEIKTMYGSEITGLRNMEAEVCTTGETTVITFRHQTGNKG